jgi:transcription antitermination factor NusB
MRKRTQARECALQILYQADITGNSMDEILSSFWETHPVPDDVREFAERIVRGTKEHLSAIDQKIVQYTENWQLSRMAVVDRTILRFAAYELLFVDEIPPKVTINEAVNIAKKYSQEDAGKFVNGILDKINHMEVKKPA